MKIYLCGAINGRSDAECKDWRAEARRLLAGHEILDPMDRDYRGMEDANVAAIVEDDKADIDACDVLLVRFDRPSVGTSMEIVYAWERDKLVVVTANTSTTLSPWLRYHAHVLAKTLQEAAEEISYADRILSGSRGCLSRGREA